MAQMKFSYTLDVSHNTSLLTAAQFLVASNMRALLHGIDLLPLGATAASTGLQWLFGKQDDAGTSSDDSANLVKMTPSYSQSIQTTVRDTFSVEPAKNTPAYNIVVHQQGSLYKWRPNAEPIVMEAGERWGLWYLAGQSTLTVRYQFYLEE